MAKERIKENVIDAPTLFVGVGGTGCRIVRRVAEMCRPGERENVNFVCLDTNVNDLASVSGSRSHIYTVQTSNSGRMRPVLMVEFRARREMARTCPAPSDTVLSYRTAFLGNQLFSASAS